jgi:hypothetical protein
MNINDFNNLEQWNENQEAIAAVKAETIPSYDLDSFSRSISWANYQKSGQNT